MSTNITAEIENKLFLKIDELKLSMGAYNALRHHQIETVSDIVQMNEKEILRINGIGKKYFNEIKDVLSELGFSLNMRFLNLNELFNNISIRLDKAEQAIINLNKK